MSAILDALGYLGDAIDKPGRAVRGLLSGNTQEGLAAIPFSDSLGLTDPSQRVSGQDLLRSFGMDAGDGIGGTLAGIGAELATDPLTWTGAGLGALAGRRAGAAAMARGPQYGTTLDDVSRMVLTGGGDRQAATRMVGLQKYGEAGTRAASELHPESRFLGAGAEGLAFSQPSGDVVRIGRVGMGDPGRPIADGVLGTTRALDIPYNGGSAFRVERSPFAAGVGDQAGLSGRLAQLDQALPPQGLRIGDRHAGNIGDVAGRPVVIDPGSVDALNFTGRREAVGQAAEPGQLLSALISMGGGNDAVRAAIEAGRRSPGFTPRFAYTGGGVGSLLGETSRL